jgi:putative transposase
VKLLSQTGAVLQPPSGTTKIRGRDEDKGTGVFFVDYRYIRLCGMARHPRAAPGGMIFHVINRAAGRRPLFRTPGDFAAFERILADVQRLVPGVRLLAYCLMGNHWHLVLWPRADGELSEFMRRVTVTHAQRLHARRGTAGTGPVYQGRFKSFPVEADDRHLLMLCRYVERNALRARLVRRAERWPWGSLARRAAVTLRETAEIPADERPALTEWPVDAPGVAKWVELVNEPMSPREQEAVALSIRRSSPLGSETWSRRTAERLDLRWTLRPRGRPRKSPRADGKRR